MPTPGRPAAATSRYDEVPEELRPDNLLAAYAQGVFPMADEAGRIHWYSPVWRGILPLGEFHVPRTLRQVWRQRRFEIAINRDFPAVIRACADRPEGTWISREIIAAYTRLHELGFAHSVEAYRDGALVGGLYGVALRGAFFGESMFHRAPNASKVALVALVERLRERGFLLLDVQYVTPHLRQFGAVAIPRRQYLHCLRQALERPACFYP